ncbi:MAG: sel1 repeat family protein [Tyzzerella sp.]|nr:sel1 repeat family protein [Tyzzerella sp.]
MGVQKDLSKVFEWFEKAAGQNHTESQFILGECHYMGRGVPQNEKRRWNFSKKPQIKDWRMHNIIWDTVTNMGMVLKKMV